MIRRGVNSAQHFTDGRAIRMPLIVIAAFALMALGALTIFWSAVTVNRTKNLLVEEAREEALRVADQACMEIERVLADGGVRSLEELVARPEVQAELSRIAGESGIVLAAISDTEGRVLFQQVCEDQGQKEWSAQQKAFFEHGGGSGDGVKWETVTRALPADLTPIELPLHRGGVQVGRMQIALSSQVALARIDALGQQITSDLAVMVLLFLAVMLLAMALAWAVFLRQMELQRRTSETEHLAQIGALAAGLAHEIRNPLHAMGLHLDVVREDLEANARGAGGSDSVESIARVQRQVEHLNGVVGNFLSIAIPSRMIFRRVELNRSIREALRFLAPEFEAAGIQVEEKLHENAMIEGDEEALQRVFVNLLVNARQVLEQTSHGPPRVRVRARREGAFWEVLFEDSGPGIPPGSEEKIFRPFVSKRCGGTGFGLALARRIVEGHGGTLSACRSSLGGACLTIRIPVLKGGSGSWKAQLVPEDEQAARVS